MAMKESSIGKRIQIALSEIGVRVFRNNVGMLKDERGQRVQYGLCVGSSDYIGWKSVEITPDMVGRKVAVFTAIEVKRPGQKPTMDQQFFIKAVRDAGGIATVCSSTAEALAAVQR